MVIYSFWFQLKNLSDFSHYHWSVDFKKKKKKKQVLSSLALQKYVFSWPIYHLLITQL